MKPNTLKPSTTPIPRPKGLQRVMKERRYNQGHVAEWLGIHQGGISRWMNGKQDIKLGQALTIAKKLGITIDEMLEGKAPARDVAPGAHWSFKAPPEAAKVALTYPLAPGRLALNPEPASFGEAVGRWGVDGQWIAGRIRRRDGDAKPPTGL